MVDEEARQAIGESLDETLIVEAAAGTGKTTELVRRILRTIATGRAAMTEIVAVTFTEKAAGELKLRLREALEGERAQAADADQQRRLEQALSTLEDAHVNTIHGFCAELLRERPVEACVDPLFTVLTEPQADRLYARAFRAWLQDALRQPSEGLRRGLRRTSSSSFQAAESGGPIDRLRNAGRTLAEWRHFPHPWQRPAFDRREEILRLVSELHAMANRTANPLMERDNLFADTGAVRRLSQQIKLEQSFGHEDLDGWESRLVDLTRDRGLSRTRKGSGAKYSRDISRTDVLAARDSLYANLLDFRRRADADLAAALQHELAGATERYQEAKRTAGALDFADLLATTRTLLRSNHDVRRHLQRKFRRIFVDEFQDTDPVQAEILLLLSSSDPALDDSSEADPIPGKLFIVGDPKQAIYRFRGTGVETYQAVKEQLGSRGARVLQLTTSYRSLPAIQAFVNAAFAAEMHADARSCQAEYVPLSRSRLPDESQPAIVGLPVPRPYGRTGQLRASAKAIEASLPDAVGAFIAWLVDEENRWQIAERQADGSERRVPIQARHIAVLFRRFVSFGDDVTRGYVSAIEARGIPHLLVGGKAFHDREEVDTIRAALSAIEWPDDELSVFATLKGSLFAIDDEPLLEFRHRFGAFHPFRIPRELGGNSGRELVLTAEETSHLSPIADALRLIQRLHRGRNYRPLADTIGQLLGDTRAHVGFILRPAGEQVLANVLHVAELARQYEMAGGTSYRGFIDELRTAAEHEAPEAPILEDGSDGVRLMTVHKAKGLEFPVVILADPTCRMNRDDASRYLDPARGLCALRIGGWSPHELHEHEDDEVARDQAEGVRLAYVAATRARDLLVVPTLGDEPWEGGWLQPLNRAVYPLPGRRRSPVRGQKCPSFKSKDSVLERPHQETAGPSTVCPGLHVFDAGYSVVWWDPGALSLGAKPPFGVRREDLIVKDVPRDVVADGRSRYDRWRLARLDARTAGSAPSIVVGTVREWAAGAPAADAHGAPHADAPRADSQAPAGGASHVAVAHVPRPFDEDRPHGPGFGSLVHGVLARVPFDADRRAIEDLAAFEAVILGLTEDDVRSAVAVVERVLAHEVMTRAHSAHRRGACRRESPITYVTADGTLLEGIVDLAFEHGGAWTVVDYKTDRELAAAGDAQYRRQVALYATAIARATSAPCSGIILVV
jgi:ATP-dependent exoDNAse (exonuclease V) beta subunit